MDMLIQLIIALVVAGIIWVIGKMVIDLLPLPPPIKQIVNLLMILVLVLIIIYYALLPLLHFGVHHY